ncbi:MAG: 1-(5-phosphoribosyl)-5-[(5-phosphoribosylamino)methylideneamino]imidazole-4-carboxamide isomerase [Lentisphaerae bacterium GWF2_45_14]|nr:MAG: 1-(5-phosphoribosyl)-5-[(5-phosphoribosylamino)methylideneamino]imidazole-4-carboxamide isomerase [Lentisphaerae bacterium GWF2_45_14]
MLIIPAIDIRNGKCVRLVQGDYARETVYSDSPSEQALKWQDGGARFIHLVDLDGAKEGKPVNLGAIREICSALKIPAEMGGGIRTIEDVEKVLDSGVSRVIIGTTACENPELIQIMLEKFGPEKIVIGIDAKNGKAAVKGWLESSGIDAVELAVKMTKLGVRKIIYTDISTDGMLSGPNLQAAAALCDKVPSCGIISSGGISCADNVSRLIELERPNLEAVIVGKALYDGRVSLAELLAVAGE